jgi:hypothetical protein
MLAEPLCQETTQHFQDVGVLVGLSPNGDAIALGVSLP